MKRSAFISDIIFTFVCTFLFTLCLFRYFKIPFWAAFALASVCGALGAVSFFSFTQSKRNAYFLKKSDEKEKDALMTHLSFLSDEGKTNFFLQYFLRESSTAKRFGRLRIYTEDAFYTLHFTLSPANADDVLKLSRFKTQKRKVFLCASICEEGRTLAQKIGVEVQDGEAVYYALKKANALPMSYLGVESKKKSRRQRHFSRANAKRFFLSAILLLFSSLLSPFPYYYLLFGGILLLSSLCIRIFGVSEA